MLLVGPPLDEPSATLSLSFFPFLPLAGSAAGGAAGFFKSVGRSANQRLKTASFRGCSMA